MACIGRATAGRQQAADTSAHQHATDAQPDSSTISVDGAWIGEEECCHRGVQCRMGPVVDWCGDPDQMVTSGKARRCLVQVSENRT